MNRVVLHCSLLSISYEKLSIQGKNVAGNAAVALSDNFDTHHCPSYGHCDRDGSDPEPVGVTSVSWAALARDSC